MENKKEIFEKRSLSLITTEGKEITVEYEVAENSDDHILEEIREALKNNAVYNGFEWADFSIKFGDFDISELDFKKIIGINW